MPRATHIVLLMSSKTLCSHYFVFVVVLVFSLSLPLDAEGCCCVQVVDQGMSFALTGLLQSLVEASTDAPVVLRHLLACLKHVTQCMARSFTESLGAWTEALQNLAGHLKLLAQNPELRQHLQQTGVQGLLICTADELLEVKPEHTPVPILNPQQTCGGNRSARYDHMDVEVEEI